MSRKWNMTDFNHCLKRAYKDHKRLGIATAVCQEPNGGEFFWVTAQSCIDYRKKKDQVIIEFKSPRKKMHFLLG